MSCQQQRRLLSVGLSIINSGNQTRHLTQTAVRLMPRHPLIRANISSNKTVEFAEEFKINQTVAESIEPWVPEKDRKRSTIARQRRRLEEERRSQLSELAEKVSQFNLTSSQGATPISETSEGREDDSNAARHPDIMEEYREQVKRVRQQYARELAEKRAANKEKEASGQSAIGSSEQSAGTTEPTSADFTSTTANEQQQQQKDIQQALDLLQRYALKSIRYEQHRQQQRERIAKQQEELVRLYHQAESFITPESLEAAINECLDNPKPFRSLTVKDLSEMAVDERRRRREIQLYDALNETLEQRQSVSRLIQIRREELDAFRNHTTTVKEDTSEDSTETSSAADMTAETAK